jgi:serine/threonine protein kinase
MAQNEQALEPSVVGRFRVVERLGKGGMAEVFLGVPQQPLTDDPPYVALKRLLPAVVATQPETVKMLMDEAAILSRLQHKNIIRLIDVCTSGGSTYLVLELLDGVDLSTIFKKFAMTGLRIPWAFSASVVADVAEALAYAAEALTLDGRALGLVHRDISPHNIFVHADGSVRLLDFGVARAADRMTQTRTGNLKGKLAYMSPEQAAGEEVDHRSDIFALGIVLYEFTVGRRPFKGKNEFTILQSVIGGKISWPSEMYANFPVELERIIRKMLARPLDERYQHARDVAVDLRAWLATLGNVHAHLPAALMAKHFPDKIELARKHAVLVDPAHVDGPGEGSDGPGLFLDVSGSHDASGNRVVPTDPLPVEKAFVDDATVLIVHRFVAAGAWRRIFDGLEGEVRIRFVTVEDAAPHAAPLLSALAALIDDIDAQLEQAPLALVQEWQRQRARLPHVTVTSGTVACPHCGLAQVAAGASVACAGCHHPFTAFAGDASAMAALSPSPSSAAAAATAACAAATPTLEPAGSATTGAMSASSATSATAEVRALPLPQPSPGAVGAERRPRAAIAAVVVGFIVVAVVAFLLGRGTG